MLGFFDAFKAALDGNQMQHENGGKWYHVEITKSGAWLVDKNGVSSWPEDLIEGMWRIRKKVKEEKETILWGVCDDDGTTNFFLNEPVKADGEWIDNNNDDNFFPKDKPQKFKLVPVDEEF